MDRTSRFALTVVAVAILLGCVGTSAQTKKTTPATDLSWIRDFAVPATPETQAADQAGQENRLNWDPRFAALLKVSLRQRQSFWFDHGRFKHNVISNCAS